MEARPQRRRQTGGLEPRDFIRGMVNVPVPTTLATAEPLMEPIKPEARPRARAGLILPVRDGDVVDEVGAAQASRTRRT